ncbi:MAG: AAA family ATPase [Oscillospiraceae bacterium]
MIEKIRAELISFIEETGTKQKQIADESGLSSSVVSQFISNTYTGDNVKAADTLNKYLKLAKERLNVINSKRFYKELGNTQLVLGAVAYAHKHCEMTLIRGASGAGKTTALKYYADNNAGVVFVTANSTVKTGKLILQEIAATMGKNCIGCNIKQTMDKLLSMLSGTKRLIIIDEADRLSLNALQAVRDLNDIANVGVVLAGNNKLYTQMYTGVKGSEFDQIRTRILFKPMVTNNYTLDEICGVFPEANKNVATFLMKKANNSSLRESIKLFDFGMEMSKIQNVKLTGNYLASLDEEF